MPNKHLTALLLAGLVTACQAQPQTKQVPVSVDPINAAPLPAHLKPTVEAAFHSINPMAIKATMSFLADDLVEGRQPGTRGFAIASRYIQTRFIALGLQPAGDNGTYVQSLTFKKGVPIPSGCSLSLQTDGSTETLINGTDFLIFPNQASSTSEVTAPLAFIGYGVYAPELKYDDYGSLDIKGKIAVFFDGAPTGFPSNERAFFSSAATKYAEAVKRGAVGVLQVMAPGGQRSSFEAAARRVGQGNYKWADPQGYAQGTFEQLKVIGALNAAQSQQLFAKSGKDETAIINELKAGKPQPLALRTTATMKSATTVTDIQTSNLVGILPGSDPVLKNEYIIYTAHLDHFGIGAPVNGDSIYNGAHDDASGVAILMEIAQTFRSLPKAPKRSIIIAVVTGEEYGLLGSDYFANNPTVPRKQIVADLSIDMPFFFHPVLDVVPYGAQHSSLSAPVETAAKYMGLKIGPDPFPEQVIFIRSDHYSFIRKGIPALFIKSGFMTVASDTVDRSKSDVGWRSTTYHTPKDDMNQPFDFDAAATHVRFNFLIGLLVGENTTRPSWNKGDFFGGRFGNSQ
ncbi:MAG TPA: M28 family metallopeptidase [Puia sp.]